MMRWREDEGYVTVAVVGVTALMAALVAGLLALSRPTAVLTRIDVEQLRGQVLIEAGLNAAAFLLFFAGETPSEVSGRQLAVDGGEVSIAVSPEKGRIDLNTSSPDLLRRLFAAAKGTSMSPDAFAARVADWRDEDNDRTIEGAEAFDYTAVPGGIRPANAPFRSVAELRFLLGLGAEDRAAIEPFLTTFNRDGSVDPEAAVGLVRTALTGDRLEPDTAPAEPPAAANGAAPAEDAPEAFRVEVVARTAPGGPVRAAEVIIAPPVDERESYSVLEWHGLTPPPSADGSRGDLP